MAFPLTHLCVAWRILETHPMNEKDAAQFMLGSIAPDAVHYRTGFINFNMAEIGAAKKITHLCPVSDERWGQVTDNDGWVECVKKFLNENPKNPFIKGFAVHALTDICNNITIWKNFREKFPEEAAKGYESGYYADLRHVDTLLYREFPAIAQIMKLLSVSVAEGIPAIVTAQETEAIKNNLLFEQYVNPRFTPNYIYRFTAYADTLNFINEAAEFSAKKLLTKNGFI